MAKEKILIVDDEKDIIELIDYNLTQQGYRTDGAVSGEEALEKIRRKAPDLILLDLMLPGLSGLDVMISLRKEPSTETIPVIMLTAKGEEADIVTGLEMGADDYISKPFSTRILIARIRAVLRRREESARHGPESILSIHDLRINMGTRVALCGEEKMDLTYMEFQILFFLSKRPGWVFTRSQMVDAIWGDGCAVTDRSVDVQISGLRKKMGPCGTFIETVRGVGYKMKGEL